ncbi:hypothetical protein E2C01_082755 [Portunus trituberculatus]|uniref:Uncharacterized protein n=1 Tax=Portunus trituberculatus TaxID=210409 RepID=A0A5B7IZA7_PORTR|nr:hypothetical protein [Portunus trituberculatus]
MKKKLREVSRHFDSYRESSPTWGHFWFPPQKGYSETGFMQAGKNGRHNISDLPGIIGCLAMVQFLSTTSVQTQNVIL